MRTKICIYVLLGILIFSSCRKEQEKALIEYYITTKQSRVFKFLSFSLLWTRAHKENTYRSVYLDPIDLFFNTDSEYSPDTIYLGSSEIEPGIIEGYDYWIVNGRCAIDQFIFNLLDKAYYESNASTCNILVKHGEIKKILFVVDVDESVVMTPNRDFKFLPKIHVVSW